MQNSSELKKITLEQLGSDPEVSPHFSPSLPKRMLAQ